MCTAIRNQPGAHWRGRKNRIERLRRTKQGRRGRKKKEAKGEKRKEIPSPNIFRSAVECTTVANWKEYILPLLGIGQDEREGREKRGGQGRAKGREAGLHNARDFIQSIGSPIASP